jgi:hypothetical protein
MKVSGHIMTLLVPDIPPATLMAVGAAYARDYLSVPFEIV